MVEANHPLHSKMVSAMDIRLNNTRRGWLERRNKSAKDGVVAVENEGTGGVQEELSNVPDDASHRSKVMKITSLTNF